ncbi:transposable element Tc1 transposase [Trichonephila clavipes]|nr:transposable element Tc1 transposase [Trichonephila clavipes]
MTVHLPPGSWQPVGLLLQVYDYRAWQADWPQVAFSDESRFKLWDHDGRFRVRRYAGERCITECVIVKHNGLTPKVMVWSAILYHGRSNLLRIEGNLNSNKYVHEVVHPEVVPFLEGIPGAVFQQDNERPHVAKTVLDFCSDQHMQLLLWPAYSPDMSSIEHVCDSARSLSTSFFFKRRTFAAHTSKMLFSYTSIHSKPV